MTTVLVEPQIQDDARRNAVFRGEITVSAPTATTNAFCAFARELIDDAFGALDPEFAQDHLPVERYASNPQRAQASIHSPSAFEGVHP